MDKIITVSARVPDHLYQELKMMLLIERTPFRQWLATQMQRAVEEFKAARGKRE